MGTEEIYLNNLEQEAEDLVKKGKGSIYYPLLDANKIKNNFDLFLQEYVPPTQGTEKQVRDSCLKILERANIALLKCRNNLSSKGSTIHDHEKKGKERRNLLNFKEERSLLQ